MIFHSTHNDLNVSFFVYGKPGDEPHGLTGHKEEVQKIP